MATIIIRNSTGSGAVPSSLVQGELAINTVDGKLFYGSGSGNIVKEFTASNSLTASYLNTLNQNLTFNGNLTLNGTASISTLVVNQTQYSSGSNQLGDAANDTQTLFGSVIIPTGSLTVSGSITTSGSDARFNDVRVGLGGGQQATNTVLGANSLVNNTTGTANIAVGYFTLTNNTIGSENTAIGNAALTNNVSGGYNTAIGRNAGRYIADGATALTVASQSVFIGGLTKALANSQTNQIVIGYNATGLGSNSVVLGDDSITRTALKGNISIGTTGSISSRLHIQGSGTTSATTALRVENTNASASLVVLDNGFVGINTGSAQYSLDVNGTARVSGVLQATTISFRTSDSLTAIFPTNDQFNPAVNGNAIRFQSNTLSSALFGYNFINATGGRTWTSGTGGDIFVQSTYSPTSGNGVYNLMQFNQTINQTGGANGITRGIFINTTLSASADYRAIETTSGSVIFNHGATPLMFISSSGNVGINTNTPGMSLSVVGNAQFGFTSTSAGARLHTRGAGNTNTSTSFRAENANQLPALRITDDLSARFDGKVSIGSGNFPTASLDVAGTTRLSGSFNTAASGSILTVIGSGSTQPIFTVQGSQGELFSITDSLTGSLFSVNDISGLPILEVFSDNTTLIGDYQDPMLITTKKVTMTNSGSFVVYSLPTASYDTAFFDYSIKSGSNARAGQIMAIQSGSSVNFTETTTTDFGSTTAVSFTVLVSGSNMVLTGSAATGSWTIKTIVRGL